MFNCSLEYRNITLHRDSLCLLHSVYLGYMTIETHETQLIHRGVMLDLPGT